MENILVDRCNGEFIIKLCDFGFSTFITPNEKLNHGVGSRFYIAPEILAKRSYDEKVDVWSATIVTYILLIGKIPYPGKNIY